MQFQTAIVTGGAGFIGSHLVDALVRAGIDVTVIDWAEVQADRKNSKATYIRADIRDSALEEIFRVHTPDVVFHLAAHIFDRASVLDPVMNAEHNELGTIRVLESSAKANVKKVVFASSCAVYGVQNIMPINESALARPMTPYGISKRAGELYADAYGARGNMHTVSLRFGNVYGPRQMGNAESGAIAIFTEKLLANTAPFLHGDGSTTRDYVFVGDIVSALLAAAQTEISGVYNVGTGVETATRDLFSLIQKEVGTMVEPIVREDVKDAVSRMVLDSSRLRADTGWSPAVALANGIAQTVAWYKAHGM